MLACLLIPLGACASSGSLPRSQLPALPADVTTCFRDVVDVPDRALTVAEVEQLWKQDRVRAAASKRCGARLVNWYGALRGAWR